MLQCEDDLCKNKGSRDATCCTDAAKRSKYHCAKVINACDAEGLCTIHEDQDACLNSKKKVEGANYKIFFWVCAIVVLLLEVAGAWYLVSQESLEWRNVLLVMVVGVRTFDMMSDWYVGAWAHAVSALAAVWFGLRHRSLV